MKRFYILTLLSVTTLFSMAQVEAKSNHHIAMDYMRAYGQWDFDTMKSFYADQVHFEDVTAKEAFKQAFVFDGKEDVYQFFKHVFANKFENVKPSYVHFNIQNSFTSNSTTVVHSIFDCIIPTSWFDESSTEVILISIPFTTILTIEDGLIVQHLDYGDYDTYFEQIRAQLKH